MSYPPYPSFNPNEQGMYPPPPQHATTPLSYPIYPGSAAPPAPSGYPQSMPMPSANPYPPYPGQPSPYSNQPSFPSQPSSSPYPPQHNSSPYPPQPVSSPYQPQSSPYPPNHGSSPYPPQPTPALHSSHPTSYPSQPTAYPSHYSSNQTGGGSTHSGGNTYSSPPYGSHSGQMQQPTINKGTPTLRPAHPFNPREDAEILRKAMKGFGTDEKALIEVLANRTNAQRQEIAVQFKTLYGKDLVKDIKSEVSGNFEDVLVKMMTPIPYFLAKEICDAISGIGTDEETLIEILCTSTNNDIHMLRNAYAQNYGASMEESLASDTSGSFRRLLVSLCQGNRSENYHIDHAAAQSDAQALLRAGELKLGTDESTFNAILCSRSYPQLRQIFEEYHRITGHDFTKAIENEFSGDIKEGLLAIVKSVRDRPGYFAERLYQSMKGFGTKDRTLQRIAVVRCEIDMGDIKQSFQSKYGTSLEEFIKGDCSGDYKRTLIALVS